MKMKKIFLVTLENKQLTAIAFGGMVEHRKSCAEK